VSVVVAVKPSARKRNAKVGRLVFEDGPRHAFESRAAAERWADDLSTGDGHVWVASAHPRDGDDDCYLVSRATARRPRLGRDCAHPLSRTSDARGLDLDLVSTMNQFRI